MAIYLTKTEAEIIEQYAHGLRAQEIASRRFRTIGTIRKHVEHARQRTGCHSLAELVYKALKEGLIT